MSRRENRKNITNTLSNTDVVFIQEDPDNDFGEPVWLGRIFPNMVNYEFQKQPLWEADKCINLDGIRLDCGDIGFTIQWYDQVPGIFESDIVYRIYRGQLPQVQSYT